MNRKSAIEVNSNRMDSLVREDESRRSDQCLSNRRSFLKTSE